MKLELYKVNIDPERIYFYFDNLFDGNKRLGEAINNLFNENWRDIFDDIKMGYEESFGLVFRNLGQMFYKKIPFNNIYLP